MKRKFTKSPIVASESLDVYTVYVCNNESAAARSRDVENSFDEIEVEANSVDDALAEALYEVRGYLNEDLGPRKTLERQDPGSGESIIYGLRDSSGTLVWEDDYEYWESLKESDEDESEESSFVSYAVYTIYIDEDDDVEEIDRLDEFDTVEEATEFIEENMGEYADGEEINGMHIVAIPSDDSDPECKEWFEYFSDYEMWEIVETFRADE